MCGDRNMDTAFRVGVVGCAYLYPLVVMDVARRQLMNAMAPRLGSDGEVISDREPFAVVADMPADAFFAYAADLLIMSPPHFHDYPILAQLQHVGFVAGQPFDLNAAPPIVRAALRAARKVAVDVAARSQAGGDRRDPADGLPDLVARPGYEIGQHSA